MFSVFVVGGVRSPWKGEYRAPRRLALHKENSPQTSLPPTTSPTSAAPHPEPAARGCSASPVPPPALERARQGEGTRWNESRDLSRTWDPPPLSSAPLPLKSCSHTERASTISEQELQQLEIGTERAAVLSSAACPGSVLMAAAIAAACRGAVLGAPQTQVSVFALQC